VFRAAIDGALLELTPQRAVKIQENLGSDIAMCLDECAPGDAPEEKMRDAVRRSILWAAKCRDAHSRADQALFGIVQGGLNLDLRRGGGEAPAEIPLPGHPPGGVHRRRVAGAPPARPPA